MEAYQAKFGKALGAAEDLGGIRPGRPVHHRPDGARTSTAPGISARPAARATSSTSCSSSAPTAASSSTTNMKAQLASAGRRQDAGEHDRRQQRLDPRQQRARRGVALGGVAARQGGDDLLLAADRAHDGRTIRRATRRSTSSRSRTIAGKVGYAVVPGNPEHATGYNKALVGGFGQSGGRLSVHAVGDLAAGVARARACCPMRCAIPTACRTSSRTSTPSCGRTRRSTCINLNNSANVGLLDPIMPGAQDYFLTLDRMCTAVWAGADPKAALETAAAEWDDDHRAPRRRLAEGVLRGVHEAAGRVRRQHGREARHGGEARLTATGRRRTGRPRRSARLAGMRRLGIAKIGDGLEALSIVRHRAHAGRRRAAAAVGAVANGPTAISSGCWSRRRSLLILALSIYPLLFSSGVSFINYDFQIPGHAFVGLKNFERVIYDPVARWSLVLTAFLSGASVAVEFLLGLGLALAMVRTFRGRGLIMSILIVPLFISPVIVGQVWALLLQRPFGPTNYILEPAPRPRRDDQLADREPVELHRAHPRRRLAVDAVHVRHPARRADRDPAEPLRGGRARRRRRAGRPSGRSPLPHLAPMMLLARHLPPARRDPAVRHDLHHDRRRPGHPDLHRLLLSLHGRLHPVPPVARRRPGAGSS